MLARDAGESMTSADDWAPGVVHLAQLYIGGDRWVDRRDVTRHVAMAVRKIQADAIRMAAKIAGGYAVSEDAERDLMELAKKTEEGK